MLKKSITYKDFTGEEQTEDFYFHLTEADLIELEVSANGNSLSAWAEKIAKTQNGLELITTFKKIINVSYGVKSNDGRRFIKSDEVLAEFKSTNAYSKLFFELATDAEKATEFVNGIMPDDMPRDPDSGLSASEIARKRSQEAMQGRQAKAEKPKESTVERQPDLPVELQTAAPVLEAPTNATNEQPNADPEQVKDLQSMSADELRALLATRGLAQSAAQ